MAGADRGVTGRPERGRPEVLWPLFGALDQLDGIGPKTAQAMATGGIERPRDLLFTLPYAGVDRAFAKLDTIKKDVVWWEAGAQPVQLLADGEVTMATGSSALVT